MDWLLYIIYIILLLIGICIIKKIVKIYLIKKKHQKFFQDPIHKKKIKLDKIYYINLDRRPDRQQHFLQQCRQENIDMKLIQRFQAIDGKTLKLKKEEEKLFENCDYKNEPYKKNIMGNQLSHYYILQDMIINNYQYILILQDDVVFKKDFNKYLDQVLNSIPDDAEIVNIGLHKHSVYADFKPLNLESHENKIYCIKDVNSSICIIQNIVNPCSLAYIVTRKGAINLCRYFQIVGFLKATDWNYNEYLQQRGINYASKIVLCTGALMGSDIFCENN